MSAKPFAYCPHNQINTAADSSCRKRHTHPIYGANMREMLTSNTDLPFDTLKLLDGLNESVIRLQLIGNSFVRRSRYEKW